MEPKNVLDPEPRLQLDSEAHRRWKTSVSVEFLKNVSRVDIHKTRSNKDSVVLYRLEVLLSQTSSQQSTLQSDLKDLISWNDTSSSSSPYTAERSFSDFEDLREKFLNAVSVLPQCTCQYCVDFVLYIRYKLSQPRSVIKLTTGVEKRKQILECRNREAQMPSAGAGAEFTGSISCAIA